MGKPLSEEAKQKIRDAFAAKRLAKENPPKEEKISMDNIIYVDMNDFSKMIEMGKQVQEGKLIRKGFATGSFIYAKV